MHLKNGNRVDMKSGDTNTIIYIFIEKNAYLSQKHCLTMRLYLEQYANVIIISFCKLKVLLIKKNHSEGTLTSINAI